ncbi:hypothetical protein QM646_37435, partial [Rhodococcus erythropolis]|nr:hypothetical protein [Rhodococcus erythropolis]
ELRTGSPNFSEALTAESERFTVCPHPVVAIDPAVGACVVHHRGELLPPLRVSDLGREGLFQVSNVEPDMIVLEFPPRFQCPTQSLGLIVAAYDDRETGEIVDPVQFDGRGGGGDCDVQSHDLFNAPSQNAWFS